MGVNRQLQFAALSAATFAAIGVLAFAWCGQDFVQEAYLHHLRRKDARHSFAMHFYVTYLTECHPKLGVWFGR